MTATNVLSTPAGDRAWFNPDLHTLDEDADGYLVHLYRCMIAESPSETGMPPARRERMIYASSKHAVRKTVNRRYNPRKEDGWLESEETVEIGARSIEPDDEV